MKRKALYTETSDENKIFQVQNLIRYFDVSPHFFNRLMKGQGKRFLKAVDGVTFDILRGKTVALVGESGCGKSTVARLVVGLDMPTAGTVIYRGERLFEGAAFSGSGAVRHRIQMVFQDPYASLNPRQKVKDIISEPICFHRLIRERKKIRDRVVELLEEVGLSVADAEKYPHEFSGGQRQRVSIARALAGDPLFIAWDEPTSALDVSVQAQILNLIKNLQRTLHLTYLFISHDLAVVDYVSDLIGIMYLGRICEWAETKAVFSRPLHPYTRLLLDAIPDLEMSGRQRLPLSGEVPSPINPPPGCPFYPRCPLVQEKCMKERPEIRFRGEHGVACHAVKEDGKTGEGVIPGGLHGQAVSESPYAD